MSDNNLIFVSPKMGVFLKWLILKYHFSLSPKSLGLYLNFIVIHSNLEIGDMERVSFEPAPSASPQGSRVLSVPRENKSS